ncbi:uncharacterized oxidoreductase At4g09670-like [Andrographis paniculata]|uniref:uncharacterized oxidoreductase At4g09670-like n=1 Tax=Andrographis paniculata TaxID=175694 RepID=UPI0021E8B9E6|nr:uncharacterized oxidoreductase At4g09670-like [Andrographis paniculata]
MAKNDDGSPVRFGIMGCAVIARKLAAAIAVAPSAALVAVASRSIDKAQQFAVRNNLSKEVKLYGSYEELLEDPSVDAVYLPLPTSLHVRWVTAAAEKGKHVLLEKPTALDAKMLDEMLHACEANRVQFMDASMWYHHPRTLRMKGFVSNREKFGEIKSIHSSSSFHGSPNFLKNDIRVKAELDGLGALGDTGWYCIGAILWAMDQKLPTTVRALPAAIKNDAGVILSCRGSMNWGEEGTVATFHCSFVAHATQDLVVCGSKATIHVEDFIIPFDDRRGVFRSTIGAEFLELHVGWSVKGEEVVVGNEMVQEGLMVEELSRLVKGVRDGGVEPDLKWGRTAMATQLVLDAVRVSIDGGYQPVHMYN